MILLIFEGSYLDAPRQPGSVLARTRTRVPCEVQLYRLSVPYQCRQNPQVMELVASNIVKSRESHSVVCLQNKYPWIRACWLWEDESLELIDGLFWKYEKYEYQGEGDDPL